MFQKADGTNDKTDFTLSTVRSCTPVSRRQEIPDSFVFPSPYESRKGFNMDNPALSELSFCTPSKVQCCLTYLNKEFTVMGLPTVTINRLASDADTSFLINNIYNLLQRQRQANQIRNEQDCRQIQTEGELNRFRQAEQRLQSQLEDKNRELSQLHNDVHRLEESIKRLNSSLKSEKDEVRRLTAVFHQKQVQFTHEVKKKEQVVDELRNRVHQLLKDKVERRHQKQGIVVLNDLPPNHQFRYEGDMYHKVIANYEETQRKLLQENSALRWTLSNVQEKLNELLRSKGSNSGVNDDQTDIYLPAERRISKISQLSLCPSNRKQELSSSMSQIPQAFFEMPFELPEGDITPVINQKLYMLLQKMQNIEKLAAECSQAKEFSQKMESMAAEVEAAAAETERKQEQEIAHLKNVLQNCENIMAQLRAAIEYILFPEDGEITFLKDTDYLEDEKGQSSLNRQVLEAKKDVDELKAKLNDKVNGDKRLELHKLYKELSELLQSSRENSLLYSDVSSPLKTVDWPHCENDLRKLEEFYHTLAIHDGVIHSSPVDKSLQASDIKDKQQEGSHQINVSNCHRRTSRIGISDEDDTTVGLSDRVRMRLFPDLLLDDNKILDLSDFIEEEKNKITEEPKNV